MALVRDALADAGFDITLLGPDAPRVGEGVYFQSEPFGDEVIGLLADALTLRGIGAYGYALVDSSLGGELADIALFMRVGDVFPRHGRHILMTRMYIQRTPTGAGNKAALRIVGCGGGGRSVPGVVDNVVGRRPNTGVRLGRLINQKSHAIWVP